MKNLPMKALAVAALLGATGAPIAVMAQEGGVAPPAAAEPARPMLDFAGPGHGRPDAFGPDASRLGPAGMSLELGLAAHLAAAETYVGISADQHEAWRGYSQALIAFFERDAQPTPEARPEGGSLPADQVQPLAAERMATQVLVHTEKARTLLDASTALRDTLEPAQLEKLQHVELSFVPGPQNMQKYRPMEACPCGMPHGEPGDFGPRPDGARKPVSQQPAAGR